MRSRRKTFWILLAILAGAGLIGVCVAVFPVDYPTSQTAVLTFELPQNFRKVRRILIVSDATKRITTMAGDNRFIESSWSKIDGEFNPLKRMRLELHGSLKVQSMDEYIGKPIVHLTQTTWISLDTVHSQAKLAEPAERLLDYELTTEFTRNPGGNTLVSLALTQQVMTKAPRFARKIADRRVLESAQSALQNQKDAIIGLIDGYE